VGSSCYQPHRDIVIPPRHSLSSSLTGAATMMDDLRIANSAQWLPTVYFRGTIDWKWHGRIDSTYSHGIRRKLADLYMNKNEYPNYHIIEGQATTNDEYVEELRHADFCLCPRGCVPSTHPYIPYIYHIINKSMKNE
jgi:hypothetical protein